MGKKHAHNERASPSDEGRNPEPIKNDVRPKNNYTHLPKNHQRLRLARSAMLLHSQLDLYLMRRAIVQQVLDYLGYSKPNTSAIERRNGTARRMSAHQVRCSLAFARRDDTKIALGWWALTVYNWCRSHRSLRLPLPQPLDKKSSNPNPQRWRWALPIISGRSANSCSHRGAQFGQTTARLADGTARCPDTALPPIS